MHSPSHNSHPFSTRHLRSYLITHTSHHLHPISSAHSLPISSAHSFSPFTLFSPSQMHELFDGDGAQHSHYVLLQSRALRLPSEGSLAPTAAGFRMARA